ncbi:MAG: hypothetical protein IJ597_02325 [Synergistaceae bacterium]|nr:hypothetical protein [Synergistaceae bacterium]
MKFLEKFFAFLFVALIFTCAPAVAAPQYLRDSRGLKIGMIKTIGSRDYIYDSRGHMLGYFDGRNTYDSRGRKIGEGNLLTTLL